jgi:glucose/arabinose dehydrogenase
MTDEVVETPDQDRPGAWRRFVRGAGVAIPVGLAGCLGGDDGGDDGDDGGDDGDVDEPETGTSTTAAFFEVSGLEPVSPTVEPGERLAVSATVTNTGDSAGGRTIEARVAGDARATESLSLDPDEEASTAFETTVPDLDPGEYSYGIDSGDDVATSTLTVEATDDDEQVAWHRDHDWEVDEAAATDWSNYEITELVSVDNLMSIDIAPDGRVFYITRGAPFVTLGHDTCEVGWVDPDTDESETALELDVQVGSLEQSDGVPARELGGQGVALDPDFAENGYVYVYYTPPADEREAVVSPYDQWYNGRTTMGYMVVSQFVMEEGQLLAGTERELIRIPDQQDSCCHRGGNLQFGPGGNLYITTGDNGGGPGIDDRWTSHPSRDAARTSGNTADLRGSVLRIRPDPDGSYSIPEGNLKDYWEAETGEAFSEAAFRPEIYAMGFRNPFIVSLDEHTGSLFVGDYGPGGNWNERGPVGLATWHLVCEPAFAGWPFFKGYYPYRRYDYDAGEPGQPFWQDNIRNDSRNNTGLEYLPPVTPATVWQAQNWDSYVEAPPWVDMPRPGEVTWPQVTVGGSANAGPAYRYAEEFGEGALDPYFEGKQFLMAPWTADKWMGYITINEDGSIEIDDFLPDHPWEYPTEMKYGPRGRLFVMDYSDTGNGGVYVIEYEG